MNINLEIKSDEKCYSYSEYVIKIIDGRKFLTPSKNAKKRKENVAVNIKEKFLELMKIGKKSFFGEEIKDAEILASSFFIAFIHLRVNCWAFVD